MTKLKTINVKGMKFDVFVDDEGQFRSEFDSELVKSESLANLTKLLSDRIKRSRKVNIPFCVWLESWHKPGHLRSGVIVGVHGGNRNVLVKFDSDTRTEQFTDHANFFDVKLAAQLEKLGQEKNRAEKAFEDFTKKHAFDAKEKVEKELGVGEEE